jgi:hypothetical protein
MHHAFVRVGSSFLRKTSADVHPMPLNDVNTIIQTCIKAHIVCGCESDASAEFRPDFKKKSHTPKLAVARCTVLCTHASLGWVSNREK